jgi:NAD(P)-dependent dehydrogenase (short-subunit alcohol dehydrogenase family)
MNTASRSDSVTGGGQATGGRTAVVTGAASGMGRMAAQRLAAAGYQVAAVDIDEAGLAETAHRSPNMSIYTCDVSDPAAVAAVVEKVPAELGPIEHLVHAAAAGPGAGEGPGRHGEGPGQADQPGCSSSRARLGRWSLPGASSLGCCASGSPR